VIEQYQNDVSLISRKVARQFGNRFDWEDIAQGVYVDMLESPKQYNSIGGNLLLSIIRRTAVRWCAQECAKFLKFGDKTIYSSEELKKLLPKFYDPSSWPNGLKQPSWDDYDNIEEFKTVLEEWASDTKLSVDMMDIEHGLDKLTQAQRNIIQKRYRDAEKLASKYEQNLHGEAIRYLTYHVNHRVEDKAMAKPVRRAVSNREAIASLGYQEDAEAAPVFHDGLNKLQNTQAFNHPLNRKSQHVVNSPWRKA
jgi:DNA-directed RNA polymerase specialized sigma24 family protein